MTHNFLKHCFYILEVWIFFSISISICYYERVIFSFSKFHLRSQIRVFKVSFPLKQTNNSWILKRTFNYWRSLEIISSKGLNPLIKFATDHNGKFSFFVDSRLMLNTC